MGKEWGVYTVVHVIRAHKIKMQVPGSPVQPMQDANHLLGDPEALRAELQSQGFLLLRGVHDRQQVLTARSKVLEHLAQAGGKLDPDWPVEQGVLLRQCGASCVPFMVSGFLFLRRWSIRRSRNRARRLCLQSAVFLAMYSRQ